MPAWELNDIRGLRFGEPTTGINAIIANLLDDLGEVQESKQSRMGYRRAAHAILLLEHPISLRVQPGGQLPKIPNVGPKSLRVVQEVLELGSSPTVEAAVLASGKSAVIEKRRSLRVNFMSFAQVMTALGDDALIGPTRASYRADFQMHSKWSDGTLTVVDMAHACVALGYQHAAMTDHGPGLPMAGGLSVADLAGQREEIDQVNEELHGRFVMLAGVEANIALDGSVDLTTAELRALDLVVAAPHTGLRLPHDQTARMIAAVRNPDVHILGHPREGNGQRGPESRPIGTRCLPPRRMLGSRSRSMATRRVRISISRLPAAPAMPAACSRSIATLTPPMSWAMPRSRLLMLGSRGFRAIA